MGTEHARYLKARAWSDQFDPQIMAVLGCFATPTDDETDRTKAIDFLLPGGLGIAARVRRMGKKFDQYRGEFTLRSGAHGGRKSELEKVLAGCGDYGFYGWVDGPDLKYWSVYDLGVFRDTVQSNPNLLAQSCYVPSSGITFNVFHFSDFPAEFLVRSTLPGLGVDDVTGRLFLEEVAA